RGGGSGLSGDTGFGGFGVVESNDSLGRRGNQDVALHGKQLVVGDARSARHAHDGAGTLLVPNRFDGIDAAGIGDAAASVTERDDFCLLFGEEARGGCAGVAESLNGYGRSTQRNLLSLQASSTT